MRNAAMRLVDGKRLPLTPAERRLYLLLPQRKKQTNTESLAKRFYRNGDMPFHGRTIITGLIRSMQRKGYVGRSERAGPKALKVWKV